MAVSEHRSHSPDRHIENVHFNEAEGRAGFVIRDGKDLVNIYPSRSSQRAPSSKLKFRNFVDYSWDYDHGNGRLISTHYSGKFIAYVVKVQGVGGAIRIVDLETNERGLMKGHRGLIKDVEFMHKAEDLIIGFVDDTGTVCVHKVTKELKTNKLLTSLMMQINLAPNAIRSELRRFMWCKYVPDDSVDPGSPRDCAYNFAVCQNDVVYVANLAQLIQRFGEGVHTLSDFKGFFMTIDSHSGTVMDASFAPDGTALATASKDGTVKFFQVYMIGVETPRCLYSWSPHDGRAVGKIFFLDDHNVRSAADSQYWKYMLTATENMSEVKLWTCKTWQCLQHIKFMAPSPTQLRMDMDISAHYLIMGDVHRKVMFVLHLSHDDESARFDWISEFSLPASMLSFNVNCAKPFNGTVRTHEDLNLLNAPDYKPAANQDANQTLLEVYFVQSKSLQQGTVIFQTPDSISRSNGHNRISFNEAVTVKETGNVSDRDAGGLEDSNQEPDVDDDLMNQDGPQPHECEITPTKSITVMNKQKSRTPSPHQRVPSRVDKMTEELSSLIGLPVTGGRSKRSPSASRSPDLLGLVTSPKSAHDNIGRTTSPLPPTITRAMSTPGDATKTSSSSSPSREVEEILSPKINNDLIGHRSVTSPSMEGVMKQSPLDHEFTHEENNHESPNALTNMHRAYMHSPNTEVLAAEVAHQLPQVLDQVSSIMEMMKAQAQEMKELKREINWLHNSQSNLKHNENENVTQTLDKYFTHSRSQIQRLEDSMKTLELLERQRIPQNNNPLPSNLAEVLATSIGQIVKTDIETCVLPSMLSLFEPTRNQIKLEAEKMIASVESRMKQDIKQVIQNDAFKTSLSMEVSSNVRPIFESVLTDIFRGSVIPSFEKALQNMYVQINDAFMKGTREYLSGLHVSLEQMKGQDKTAEILNNQFTSMQDNLTSVLQVELESQMLRVIQSLQGGVVKQIEEIMSKELTKAFRDQQKFIETSVVPRSSTPALSVSENFGLSPDPIQFQKQLTAMINMGDITGAFTQASNQGNLNLLMYLCNKVPPNQVFTKKLPLQTHLSIIQQMATEICGHTETKLDYLQTAVGALDLSDRRVLQSIARIVPIFQASVKKYVALNPGSKLSSNFNLLEMALCGIGGRYQTSPGNDVGQQSNSALFTFGPGIIKHET